LLNQRNVNSRIGLLSTLSLGVVISSLSLQAAEQSGKKTFLSAWEDRTVVLKQTLYSIVFDERPRFMPIVKRQDRVAGITVSTASEQYYQFDARRSSEQDIVDRDPDRILAALRKQYYRGKHLDIGPSHDVETLKLVRYEPGVEFVVRKIDIERDRVRLFLHKDRKADLATTLTVQWPVPLSQELTESSLIDDVLNRFLTTK
jgi:hypothetical protein